MEVREKGIGNLEADALSSEVAIDRVISGKMDRKRHPLRRCTDIQNVQNVTEMYVNSRGQTWQIKRRLTGQGFH